MLRFRVLVIRAALIIAAIPPLFRAHAWNRPQFVVPPTAVASQPFFNEEFLPATRTIFVHGPTLAELPNGDLIAAWYGGSDETQSDVCIFASTRDHRTGHWSVPQVIEDRRHTEEAIVSGIKSVGNPVLFASDRGVSLFYVAIPFGGWSTGTICVSSSPDGKVWSPARRVTASPALNLGVLVKGRPSAYGDGTIVLPVYYQLGRKGSAVLRVTPGGEVLDESRLEDGRPLIQPWIIPLSADRAMALLRWSSRMPGCVSMVSISSDRSEWASVFGTPLVHRDSAVAGEKLSDGSLLIAYNNTVWDRRDLSIARTIDDGRRWSKPRPVERDNIPDWKVRREYSYPYFYRSRDGRIHLLYTWQRTRIRHLVFSDSWIIRDPLLGSIR